MAFSDTLFESTQRLTYRSLRILVFLKSKGVSTLDARIDILKIIKIYHATGGESLCICSKVTDNGLYLQYVGKRKVSQKTQSELNTSSFRVIIWEPLLNINFHTNGDLPPSLQYQWRKGKWY